MFVSWKILDVIIEVTQIFRGVSARITGSLIWGIFILFLWPGNLPAAPANKLSPDIDILYLKNGLVLIGRLRGNSRRGFNFEHNGRKRLIPYKEINRVHTGYRGLPVCFRLIKSPPEKDCSARLLYLNKLEAGIVWGTKKHAIPLGKFAFLEFHKRQPQDSLLPLMRRNIYGIFYTEQGRNIFGRIKKIEEEKIYLTLENGKTHILPESSLRGGAMIPEQKKPQSFPNAYRNINDQLQKTRGLPIYGLRPLGYFPAALLPGLPQFIQKERWKGLVFFSGFAIFTSFGVQQYAQTRSSISSSRQDFASIFLRDGRFTRAYENHLRNQQYSFGALFALYVIHGLDLYLTRKRATVNTPLKPELRPYFAISPTPNDQGRAVFGLQYRF